MKIRLIAILLVSTFFSSVSATNPVNSTYNPLSFENAQSKKKPTIDLTTYQSMMRRYATCANRPGVIQIGLGWGGVLGGATLDEPAVGDVDFDDTTLGTFKPLTTGIGMTNNFGLRVQCGISELISAGIFVRKEFGAFTNISRDFSFNGFSFGLEGKVYPINNDFFAVYVAPSVGYSMANTIIEDYDSKRYSGKALGLNFGITAGLNWYWTEGFGMSFDVGYSRAALAGIYNDIELAEYDYTITYGGVYIGAGLVVKFDSFYMD